MKFTKSYLVCNNKFEKGSTRSFHRFPKNIEQKKSWWEVLVITGNIPFYEVLCSNHFSPGSIRNLRAGKRSLVAGAIPIAVSVLQPMNIERNKSTIESVPNKSISSVEISPNPSIASEIEKLYAVGMWITKINQEIVKTNTIPEERLDLSIDVRFSISYQTEINASAL
ncbi:hypothetical protein JTB14_033173 [Gonioctena quinquepunctata]|nr:hypothetical protein JTB14_033173 [Gonioctena quinquepunctata]